MRLIMTRGLPASGKSTWAKKEVFASGGKTKRVNKDDLRAMIDDSVWSKPNEANILEVRDFIVEHYLLRGYDVIVDDTNLIPNHEKRLSEIAEDAGADFEIKSFLDVPLTTCILRNQGRVNPVPENAIRGMFNKFVKKKYEYVPYVAPVYDPNLPDAIIVDIDGTLAHMTGRLPYDYDKVHTDVIDTVVRDIVKNTPHQVLIVSGRDDDCMAVTEEWLTANGVAYNAIWMRDPSRVDENSNKVDDAIIKEEIYNEHIKGKYNIRFVLDDRKQVVEKWRQLGLKVLQVAEGDF